MSSSSRIPLATSASVNRSNGESALIRSAATKLKRKSIGISSAASAVKRSRPLVSRPATPPHGNGPSTSTARNPLSGPLGSSMVTGRATFAGSNVSRPGIRPPATVSRPPATATRPAYSAPRQRTPPVDEEKEAMRKRLAEMEEELQSKDEELRATKEEVKETKEELKEKKNELAEEKKEKREAKETITELKEQIHENKAELREAKNEIKSLKDDLKSEKEDHVQTKKENAELIESLKREAIEKDEQMRMLHNDVVDLRGRIRVSVRVRPLLPKEKEGGESVEHLSYPDETTVGIEQQKGKVQPFSFNHVYGPTYSQQRIFDGVKDLILSVLHGYNVCLISFGQTGSGKTHTMRGGEGDAAGLIPRAVQFLFENRRRLEDLDWSFDFTASFYEVYNDCCFDLLSTPKREKREIKQINNHFVVEGLTEVPITDANRMASLLRQSDANRSTASTKCNEASSRSHALFALGVKGANASTGAKINCTLKLVDLAGSERAKESGAVGERFTEMTHINTALSNLQACIRGILAKQSHVPYRNSKLTLLLQDSLSGGSKCMVILSLSPSLSAMNETKRTLEFGKNLSHTHIGAAKKKET